MKKYIILLICGIAILQNFVACQEQKPKIEAGIYRAVIESKGGELPFGLEFKKIQNSAKLEAFVINGQEELKMDELEFFGDSVKIPMDVFDAVLVAKISKGNLYGYWKKKRKKDSYAILPFSAKLGQSERFESGILPKINVTGKWETVFISDNGKDTTVAVGVFKQNGARVEGTFLTTTGDYRYLAGNVAGDSLKLSCFDGTHLFLFKAVQKNGQLNGKFWSGTSSLENWTAKPNANAKLPDVKKLTYLKSGYDGLRFSFPDLNGKMVTKNKLEPSIDNKIAVQQLSKGNYVLWINQTKFKQSFRFIKE